MTGIEILVLVSVIFFGLSISAFLLFLGLWTYRDAQAKSEQSPGLWVLIVLLVPNLLGLIIYLLLGRTKRDVPAPKKFLAPLIGSAVVFFVAIILFVTAIVAFALNNSDGMTMNSGVWTRQVSSYRNNEWRVSVGRGNGSMRRTHSLDALQMQNFRVDSNNEEGVLFLVLTQDDNSIYTDISGDFQDILNLHDLGFEPGRIQMRLQFDRVRNSQTVISWR